MKKVVIFLVLLVLTIPFNSAKEISIGEIFQVGEKLEKETPSKEKTEGITTYFYAGAKLLASKENDELKYHYQDRLGSDVDSKSLPFGQEIVNGERFSFTGKEKDFDLHYFGARYYDSNLGKFISVDPIPGELSYGYVMNNPMNLVDPTGMKSWTMNSENYENPPEWVTKKVDPLVLNSQVYDAEQGNEITFYDFAFSGYGFTNNAGSWIDLGNGKLMDSLGPTPLTDFHLRMSSGETTFSEELDYYKEDIAISTILALAAYASAAPSSTNRYGRVSTESVRYNNKAALKTVVNGERPVALLEDSARSRAPNDFVFESQLKFLTKNGKIGGHIRTGWYGVDEFGVRDGCPNMVNIVYGKGAYAEGLARELAELYSGNIPLRPGYLPGFNHGRVGQILHYPEQDITNFLSSSNVIE
jgi:RHS repeat-associated protein